MIGAYRRAISIAPGLDLPDPSPVVYCLPGCAAAVGGNLIYPRVVGGSLGLPGIWVLLATIVGSGLAGPLGILLGVPIATVLYTLLKNDVRRREILEES